MLLEEIQDRRAIGLVDLFDEPADHISLAFWFSSSAGFRALNSTQRAYSTTNSDHPDRSPSPSRAQGRNSIPRKAA
jgi:hypothetical protein